MKGETSVKQRRGKGVTSEKRKITRQEGEGIWSKQATEVKKSAAECSEEQRCECSESSAECRHEGEESDRLLYSQDDKSDKTNTINSIIRYK